MSDVVEDVRSLVRWVYVTCDTQVALKVAVKCKAVADSHDKLTEQNKMLEQKVEQLRGELNRAACKERNKNLIQMSKVDSENKLLRDALELCVRDSDEMIHVLGTADFEYIENLLEETKC